MQTAFAHIQSALKNQYSDEEIRSFYYLIVEKISGLSYTQVIVNKNTIFSDEQKQAVKECVEKLQKKMPIQYILGESAFYNMTFEVDASTLIPRPETEELVDWIVETQRNNSGKQVLDIGTGSGCIAVALKKHLSNAEVSALDVSEAALSVAAKNAERHLLKLTYYRADITAQPAFDKQWDIIVSNPPYIPEREKLNIDTNVLDYEPHTALFVPNNDALVFYRHIGEFSKKHLTTGGELYLEIHWDAGEKTVALLETMGFREVELRKDMYGNDRMIRAKK